MPPGYLRLDGPDDECVACASHLRYVGGESFIDGRNHWYLETRCSGCGHEMLECGRDLPPRWVRNKLLELTGRWVATIEAAPGTPVMRALRKVFGCTITEAQEGAERMREGGLRGTYGEMLYLQDQLATFGVQATIAITTPGTQDRLPDRQIPDPPHRIGYARHSVSLMPGAMAEPERSQVVAYLRDASCVVATTSGCCIDPITRDPRDRIRDVVMTDGEFFIWSLAWATLVERHGIRLPADFLNHARALGYHPPKLTAQQLHLAALQDGLRPPKEQ